MLRPGGHLLAPMLLLVLAACASDAPPPPPQQLTFVDSKLFDDQLHDALANEPPSVTVSFVGEPITVNHLPERLDLWLYLLVQRYEGKIEMVPDPSAPMGKGIEGLALGLVMGTYNFARERVFHRPIKNYDAAVYFIPSSGAITRVVFLHKPKT